MEEKESVKYVDDGRTIADMSADWMPWNSGYLRRGKYAKPEKRKLSKAEKKEEKKTYRAAVLAMYRAVLPIVVCVSVAFIAVFFLMKLWLS